MICHTFPAPNSDPDDQQRRSGMGQERDRGWEGAARDFTSAGMTSLLTRVGYDH
jgi:hypothetical protein